MRAVGDILLISCYELGHQPLSLASPLAQLARAGYRPTAVDTAVEPLSDSAIAKARLVAIAAPIHTALRLGVRVAERVRQLNPRAHIVFYGIYAGLNAAYLLRCHADSVIGGEVEAPLLHLAQELESQPSRPSTRRQPPTPEAMGALERVAYAVPAREMLPPPDRYARLRTGNHVALAGYVEATRGCLHTCAHCPITPIYHGRLFAMPRDVVLADIRQQVQAGVKHITFGDPDFLNGPTHALRIARTLHAEFPKLTFDATIKIEHILEHRQLFLELRALGCVFVVSAVESLSPTVLARLRKGHTRDDVATALTILDEAGIPMRASLVAFTPWTTRADYLELLDFIAEHDLIEQVDPVQYTIRLLVPPGSALLDDPDARGWLGELDEAAFTYRWDHADPGMDRLYDEVRALVEARQQVGEEARAIFAAVYARAALAAGKPQAHAPHPAPSARRSTLPHLTEAWFC